MSVYRDRIWNVDQIELLKEYIDRLRDDEQSYRDSIDETRENRSMLKRDREEHLASLKDSLRETIEERQYHRGILTNLLKMKNG